VNAGATRPTAPGLGVARCPRGVVAQVSGVPVAVSAAPRL